MKTLLTMILAVAGLKAQSYCDTLDGYTPLILTDAEGNCYDPEKLSLPAYSSPSTSGVAARFLQIQPGIYRAGLFILYFEDILQDIDGDNFNFYTSNSNTTAQTLGAARIELVCRVYDDLSVLLHQNPWSLPDANCVRIQVQPSGTLASMGSRGAEAGPFFVVDNTPGFVHGMVAKTIQTGIDGYAGLPASYQGDPHGILKVNFGYDFNLLADASVPTLTPTMGVKLYHTILHEAAHQLGFMSTISNPTGESTLAGTPRTYNMYDKFLTKNGLPFLDVVYSGSQIVAINSPVNMMDNISCNGTTNPIEFQYQNIATTNEIVHTPPTFIQGTSLGHFQCAPAAIPAIYALQSVAGAGESFTRQLHQQEVFVLCELGYNLMGNYGTDTTTNGVQANTIVNYAVCGGCAVAAGADNITTEICRSGGALPCPSGNAVLNSITISFNTLLANDNSTGIIPTDIDTFRIVEGGGALTINANSITYTPSPYFGGTAILWYAPASDTCAVYGNYIFINVHAPTNQCDPNAAVSCNLVCNGDFESYTSLFSTINDDYFAYYGASANYYKAIGFNTPDLFYNPHSAMALGTLKNWNCPPSGFSPFLQANNSTIFMRLAQTGYCGAAEVFHFSLSKSLEIGKTYKIKMRVATNCQASEVFAIFCENPPIVDYNTCNDIQTYSPINGQSYDATDLPCSYTPFTTTVFSNIVQCNEMSLPPIVGQKNTEFKVKIPVYEFRGTSARSVD